jgi:hypothetical protein
MRRHDAQGKSQQTKHNENRQPCAPKQAAGPALGGAQTAGWHPKTSRHRVSDKLATEHARINMSPRLIYCMCGDHSSTHSTVIHNIAFRQARAYLHMAAPRFDVALLP